MSRSASSSSRCGTRCRSSSPTPTWSAGPRPTPSWPEADRSLIDPGLEEEMALARRLVALGRAARGEARMKVRQPLRRALLLVPGAGRLSPGVAAQVSEELNVKKLEVVESLAGL